MSGSSEQTQRTSLGFGGLYASQGDHIGHFYRSSDEWLKPLVSFIKTGLEADQKCISLIGDGHDREQLQSALADAGIDIEETSASGQLVIDGGKSHPRELKQMLAEALSEIPANFSLLRWAGLMSWALKKIPTAERLMEWETYCNTVPDPAAIFLCQYELDSFQGTTVMDALQTHPISIIGGTIHQNPYFVEPEAYLEGLRSREKTALA